MDTVNIPSEDDSSSEEVSSDESESDDESEEFGNRDAQIVEFSSEDDTERERCPICLNKFKGQDIGNPESCEHTFCFDCIQEWSKNINTCPIDRTEFNIINLQAVPGGNVLKKVKVKVVPKEAEETLQESVTVCEVCHSGTREDRLLLCDGCDLAYHCECLDPPLFHIPIEEWFCPPCSGVFQNQAGPSRPRTRRAIPRTRASETVRSRVQNLRTEISTAAPRSTSVMRQRRTNSTKTSPKKRKRRSYRRTIKKVVQLARTKKDMTGAKSKVGARGSTVIVTYKRRKKRRKTKRKFSRRSVASYRALPTPSGRQRIAKLMGISKPPEGSMLPQVKQCSGSRLTSRVSQMPSHSLFGNRNQLMDFDENFNEDIRNRPSTSSSGTSRRLSSDSISSSTSNINILDTIMADQKLLHVKSDKIVIKTDGSLVLKNSSSSSIKAESVKKVENDCPLRTPMSVALVKTGVKSLTSSSDKISTWKKSADTSIIKNSGGSKASRSNSNEKIKCSLKKNSTKSELCAGSLSRVLEFGDKERSRNNLSTFKIPKKQQERSRESKSFSASGKKINTLDRFDCDVPSSDRESELSCEGQDHILRKSIDKTYLQTESSSNSTSSFLSNKCVESQSHLLANSSFLSNASNKPYIKKEILSDDETDTDANFANVPNIHIKEEILSDDETDIDTISTTEQTIHVKKEVLSDEETNIDSWVKKDKLISRIKKLPISDSEANVIENHDYISNFNSSQSIIDSAPNDISYSVAANLNKKTLLQKNIKEEILSDTEDYSQSLVLNADPNFVSHSVSPYFNQSNVKSFHNKKNKGFYEGAKTVLHNLKNTSNNAQLYTKEYSDSYDESKKNKRKKNAGNQDDKDANLKSLSLTVTSKPSQFSLNCVSSKDSLLSAKVASYPIATSSLSEEDNIPCTQVVPSVSDNSSDYDDDIPCAQVAPSPTVSDSSLEDNDIPCTQAVAFPGSIVNLSEDDDLPCTQAVSFAVARHNLSKEENLPCTQAVSFTAPNDKNVSNILSNGFVSNQVNRDTEIPDAQFVVPKVIPAQDNLQPTQINNFSAVYNDSLDILNDQSSEDEIPPTQINFEALKPVTVLNKAVLSKIVSNKYYGNSSTGEVNSLSKDDLLFTEHVETPAVTKRYKAHASDQQQSKFLHCKKVNDIPNRQDLSSLPATQISSKISKINLDLSLTSNLKIEFSSLPATQISSISNEIKNVPDTRSEDEVLPATQIFSVLPDKTILHETQSVLPISESFDAPATQISDISSKNLNLPKHQVFNTSKEINLLNTQVEAMTNNSFALPDTQILSTSLKRLNSTETQVLSEENELFSLPATQIFGPTSKKGFLNAKLEAMSDESSDLPVTQISNPCSKVRNLSICEVGVMSSKLFSLPTNQISNTSCKSIKVFSTPQVSNLIDKSSTLSDTQSFNSSQENADLPATQAISVECESFTLPPTQASNCNLQESSVSMEIKTMSYDSKLMCNKNKYSEDKLEKSENDLIPNFNDIISNIKHVVNSLSVKEPETSSFQNIHNGTDSEELPHHDDHNISDSNFNCERLESDLSVELRDTKSALDEKTASDSKKEDAENLHHSVHCGIEELSHAKLKELASKSPKVSPCKKVGIHKHLPQVVATLPLKEHLKLKSSSKRTFSFEEVAKLEDTEKTQNNLSTNYEKGVKNKIQKYTDSGFNDVDDDLPPTQKIDFGTVLNKPEAEKNQINDCPVTQVDMCREKDKLLGTQLLTNSLMKNLSISVDNQLLSNNTKNKLKSVEVSNFASQNVLKGSVSDSDDSILPETQAHHLRYENNLSDRSKDKDIKEFLSNTVKRDLTLNKNQNIKNKESSLNVISRKSYVYPKHGMHGETNKSSELTDFDDLPATQVYNNFCEKKSSDVIRNSTEKSASSKYQQINSSKGTLVSGVKKSYEWEIAGKNLKYGTQGHAKEPSLGFDDFPATQNCNNVPEKTSSKVLKNSTIIKAAQNKNQSNSFEVNKLVENNPKSFTTKEDLSKLKKQPKAAEVKGTDSKKSSKGTDYKRSSYDDMPKEKNKHTDHNKLVSVLQTKKSLDLEMKVNKDHKKGSKKSLEYQNSYTECGTNKSDDRNLSSKKLKVSDRKPTLNMSDMKQSSAHRKELSSKKNFPKQNIVNKVGNKEQDFAFHVETPQTVTIKQEKIDLEFEKSSSETQVCKASSYGNLDGIKIKAEDTLEDFLPATQVANFNQTNDTSIHTSKQFGKQDNFGCAQKNILLLSCSKKEEYSDDDDEVSIIEPEVISNTKIKEEIIVDDDEDDIENTISHAVSPNLSNCVVRCDKEVPIDAEIIDISSIKKERCSKTSKVLPKSKSETRIQPEKKDSKSSSSRKGIKQRYEDSAVLNSENKNYSSAEKNRNSKDALNSNVREKQQKQKNDMLKSKSKGINLKLGSKHVEQSENSNNSSKERSNEKRNNNSLKSKSVTSEGKSSSKNQLVQPAPIRHEKCKDSSDKQRVRTSSEKENSSSSLKDKCNKNDVIITLKPMPKKRHHENSETENGHKRVKCDYSLDHKSNSKEYIPNQLPQQNGSLKNTDFNIKLKARCHVIDERISNSTPRSDISMESVNSSLKFEKDSPKTVLTKDVKKISRKQDLKEEIANEVKIVLKPFFNTGLISKDEYKDIMRKAVPKIFMNCHNCIHPEKIRKLVLSYVHYQS